MLKKSLLSLIVLASVTCLDPIIIKGTKFFKSSGEQFVIKGIGWQPREGGKKVHDPLSEPDNCKRDIENFKDLGLNLVRVYEIDQDKNHDDCMKQLEAAGIYLALDLPVPKYSVNRNDPQYNLDILNHYKQTVDMFDKYDNVAFYFAGNEVNNDKTNTNANAFVKAALRDIKAYIKTKKHKIPVGYANNDDTDIRQKIADYFNCGEKEERGDFYAVNVYPWCGDVTYEKSGYPNLAKELTDYPVPVFLSEYGCIVNRPRPFKQELQSIYEKEMKDIINGGIMYEYSYEENKYGIVDIDPQSQKVTKRTPEYKNFKDALASVKPELINMNSYTAPSDKASECPATGDDWKSNKKLPPTPSSKACECMVSKLECKASSKVSKMSGNEIGKLFSYLCSNGADCKKYLSVDAENGVYGAFSGCLPNQQLSWALNAAYVKSGKQADGCKDTGELQKSAGGNIDECANIKTDIKEGGGSGASSAGSLSVSMITVAGALFGGLLL